jgi:hypothetical protein
MVNDTNRTGYYKGNYTELMTKTADTQIAINPYKRTIGDMKLDSIIRFQIMVHCYLYGIVLAPAKIDCLTLLGITGECDLTAFCELMVEKGISTSIESSRNMLACIQKKGLIAKNGGYWKTISLHPDMSIKTTGNIWVDIDMLYKEPVNGTEESN